MSEGRRVEISLGTLCNNRCPFCMSTDFRDERRPWLAARQVKAELDHFYAKGCRSAGFLGGEPTVYPHLLECVEHARRVGYRRVALCTNGTRLADEAFCRRLIAAGVTRVTVSIHSHRPEIEDRLMTGVSGNHAKKVRGLANLMTLRAEGLLPDNVSLNPVVCRPNMGELEAYALYFEALGISDIRFNLIWPNGKVMSDPAWIPTFREAVPRLVRLAAWNEKRGGLRLSFGGVPPCMLRLAPVSDRLRKHLAGKYFDEGRFDPANDVAAPTGKDGPPERFVWQETKRDLLKTHAPRCRTCSLKASCEGLWKTYAELHGVSEVQPV